MLFGVWLRSDMMDEDGQAAIEDPSTQGRSNEAELIQKFVQHISKKLIPPFPYILNESQYISKGLFGIGQRIKDLNSYVRVELVDRVRMIGICGMGSIGKTQIARAYYDLILYHLNLKAAAFFTMLEKFMKVSTIQFAYRKNSFHSVLKQKNGLVPYLTLLMENSY